MDKKQDVATHFLDVHVLKETTTISLLSHKMAASEISGGIEKFGGMEAHNYPVHKG